MPGPATKLGSLTAHGGTVIGPGCPTVLIEKVPAIRVGPDTHICPMVTPGTPPIPHGGMTNIGPGVPNVLIGGLPASTMGDMFLCIGPPAPVVMGATTVLIGTGGAGAGGGGGGGAGSAATANALKAGTVQPVKGTETFPIDVQATMLDIQQSVTPEKMESLIKQIADGYEAAGGVPKEEEKPAFTIADAVQVLEKVERNEGFEAARFFSSHLSFTALSELAMAFTKGEDTNSDNDPNIMPTRFMILYGADDTKLQQIDDHPDLVEGEKHKNNVEFLRKSLIAAGYDIAETGPYDDQMYFAHLQYQGDEMQGISFEGVEEMEDCQTTTSEVGKETFCVSFNIDPKHPDYQDDVFTLYSNDTDRKYSQKKTVRDDAKPGNNKLELEFTGLRADLSYTLEHDPGASGKVEVLFRNRPFGEWV